MRSVRKIRGEGQIATKLSLGKHRIALALAAAAVCGVGGLTSTTLASTTDTWTGNASNDWVTSGNWNGNNPPLTGDALEFSSANSAGTNTLADSLTSSTFVIAGITYDLGSPAYVQTGNAFELTGSITDNETTSPLTINNNIALGASEAFSTAGANSNLTLGGVISGAFGISASGPGTTVLINAETFSGTTALTANSNLTFNPGSNALSINTAVSVASGATLTYTNGSTNSALGIASSSPSFTNAGTVILNGTGNPVFDYVVGTNTGNFIISMGSSASEVAFGSTSNASATNLAGGGAFIIKSGIAQGLGTKTNVGFGSALITLGDANGSTDGNNLNAEALGQSNWASTINVVGTGAGQNIIASSSTRIYSGTVTLSNANVVLSSGTYFGSTGASESFTGSLTGTGNVTITNVPTGSSINTLSIANSTFNPVGAVSTTGPGAIAISALMGANVQGFTQATTSTTTLSAANAFSGPTTISSGTLTIASAGSIASGVVNLNASTASSTLNLLSVSALSNATIVNVTTGTGTPKILLGLGSTGTPTVTVFELVINGTPVSAGTYTPSAQPGGSTLLAYDSGNTVGSLTVESAPEPSSIALLGVACVGLLRRRRSRQS